MLNTTLNQIRLNEELRDYDREIARAEKIRLAEELYWEWRMTFEDELENDVEVEEFYLELDELDRILSDVKYGLATVEDMIYFLKGHNGCTFLLDRKVLRDYE